MIESKTRDSGGFNQNAESTTAPPEVIDVGDNALQVDPLLNTIFADKYLIKEVLGAGGMSVVYLARHEALNKLFAIKTLHTHLTSKASSLLRFKQEAQAASRLQHPGIVAMHDYGVTDDGTPYLVMDYVSGESLADLLSKIQTLPNDNAIDLFKQTAAAIAHAHQRGIVHRDIKPSNIMLTFDDHNQLYIKIVDFGVAKFVESEENTKLTQTGEALGSPLYMSPEQCLGQPLDTRSDIYSFGCVMYEAITGVPAIVSDGVFKTMMKHIHEVPPSFKEVRPNLIDTEALERIVFRALAKDPAKRYQQMDDMLADLNAVHEQTGIAQKIKNKFELTGLRQTNKSLNSIIAISGLIGVAILFGASFIVTGAQSLQAQPELMSENVIWQPYADKPAIKDQEPEKRSILGAAVDIALEGDEQALKGRSGLDASKRLYNLGASNITKADSQRNHHEYDLAESGYTEAIRNLSLVMSRADDVLHSDAKEKLMIAYLGKGDCEYFKQLPNYQMASQCYEKAIDILRGTKNGHAWTQLQTDDQIRLFLRSADSFFMRGLYDQASAARLRNDRILRSADRSIKDGSYLALNQSKVAEEAFRQNHLDDAKKEYEKALKDWQQDGDLGVREQAIIAGRLAEIDMLQGSGDAQRAFTDFEDLAERVGRDDRKLLRTQFFSDLYQAYANYLWQNHDLFKAMKMHQQSLNYRP
ncbi:hypothetical protein BH10CYA1_BH10CYA1_54430 [soil metagenome]